MLSKYRACNRSFSLTLNCLFICSFSSSAFSAIATLLIPDIFFRYLTSLFITKGLLERASVPLTMHGLDLRGLDPLLNMGRTILGSINHGDTLARADEIIAGGADVILIPEIPYSIRAIILVDDGIATGASMRAAITVLREEQPKSIIVAIPIAPSSTCKELRTEVDGVVCLIMPEPFYSVGLWYDYFPQTTDEEVLQLLAEQWAFSDIS